MNGNKGQQMPGREVSPILCSGDGNKDIFFLAAIQTGCHYLGVNEKRILAGSIVTLLIE